MRPGFYIPECEAREKQQLTFSRASMRPGFYIPECGNSEFDGVLSTGASMRPGFYIPECRPAAQGRVARKGFNEAGILHPGMRFSGTLLAPPSPWLQ